MLTTPTKLFHITLLLITSMAAIACDTRAEEHSDSKPQIPIEQETIFIEFAVYYLPTHKSDPMPIVRKQVSEIAPDISIVDKFSEKITSPTLIMFLEKDVPNEYIPPDLDSIKYFGKSLTLDQAKALQESKHALILVFAHPPDQALPSLYAANQIVEHVARATGGLVWDEMTRNVYTPDSWHETRLTDWQDQIPDASSQITLHAYSTGEHVRVISLGMSKFGLPDIVIDEMSWSNQRPVGNLINITAQALVEGHLPPAYGDMDLELNAIKHSQVRADNLDTLNDNAEAAARLRMVEGTWEEGDPMNNLLQINFDRYPGKDLQARQGSMLSAIWGWEDSVTRIDHSDELLAASEAAKKKLPQLRTAFIAGLQPGEYIQVKAPFDTPEGGNEWMWVEVLAWEGDTIRGLLKNQPFDIPDLHAGQNVQVNQEDVFDYIHQLPDGTTQGNTTSEIILKMQKSQ